MPSICCRDKAAAFWTGKDNKLRKTKIVCTMGPATGSDEVLRALMLAGMNVARLNFSHGTHETHLEMLNRIKAMREELDLPVAIMLDTSGPEIRLKDFKDGKVTLEDGQDFTLTAGDFLGDADKVAITYDKLCRDVKVGGTILIDDGEVELKVSQITGCDIRCKVINGGEISNHKGVNVPNASLSLPYLSDKDRSDILFGIDNDIDYIAASFVRCADDVKELKFLLKEHHGEKIQIISKIENREGVNNLDEIIAVSDGIMVARGDLGVEIPIKEIPALQKLMIKKCTNAGKPVITATQMLDSMIRNPRPTRAEVTDVANAIYDGPGAIMLSGETAAGKYPVEAVRTMSEIAEYTEQDINYENRFREQKIADISNVTNAISHATGLTAIDINADAILTVTHSGYTARMISKFRPPCSIVGFTTDNKTYYQLGLVWGMTPMRLEYMNNSTELLNTAFKRARDAGIVHEGGSAVLTAGLPLGGSAKTNTIRIMTADDQQ